MFKRLPSEKSYPDYYVIIKQPIDLSIIRSKLEDRSYHSTEEFRCDFKLMFQNAKTYNMAGSQIFEDAVSLENLFESLAKELFGVETIPKYKEHTKVYVEWEDSAWYEAFIEKIRKKADGLIIYRVKYLDGTYANVSEDRMKVKYTYTVVSDTITVYI
jgi:hypothetical protein